MEDGSSIPFSKLLAKIEKGTLTITFNKTDFKKGDYIVKVHLTYKKEGEDKEETAKFDVSVK
jgi:hypothetical protein